MLITTLITCLLLKKIYFRVWRWICKIPTHTDTQTAENPTVFHQADDAFDNFRFLIAFIE